jgi:hypothetical protein
VFDRTTFLNVDLDISSREDLASLAAALRPRLIAGRIVITLYRAALSKA